MKHIVLLLLTSVLFACSHQPNLYSTSNQKNNTKQSEQAPYILLVSIDGFRWDYVEKYQPPFLTKFSKKSASLNALQPSFPTKTFPNHLSIVTGSYPQHHGILNNRFHAPDLKLDYSISDPVAVTNGDFYLRKPIWVIAEEQGMRTASFFWPGSEAKIFGKNPTYFANYDHGAPHQPRLTTVIDWFKLPAERRPHFVTTYFHDVDSAGHHFGPDSPQVAAAIQKVDNSLQQLHNELAKLDIEVNLVIVSDHGMAKHRIEQFEALPQDLNHSFFSKGKGPIVHLYHKGNTGSDKQKDITLALTQLSQQGQHYRCFDYQSVPAKFNANQSQRIGDITCLANPDWAIGFTDHRIKGDHGWSQFANTDMDGIFYASGPAFKQSYQHPKTANIHIMPLLAHILGLEITSPIDGQLNQLTPLLVD